jgi:hypothetical protein
MTTANPELISEYKALIDPLLPLAKKAYGSRFQETPYHAASREYTRLLSEFQERGGSLPALAKALGVTYAGVRRRVVMRNTSVASIRPKTRIRGEEVELEAVERINTAKVLGMNSYHDQLATEYVNGLSLSNIAKRMGLSSAAPLYYGVQRSIQRSVEASYSNDIVELSADDVRKPMDAEAADSLPTISRTIETVVNLNDRLDTADNRLTRI